MSRRSGGRHALYVAPGNQTKAERRAQLNAIRQTTAVPLEGRAEESRRLNLPLPVVPRSGVGLQHASYWNPFNALIETHTATTHHLAGIYPFAADPGIGNAGPVIGADLNGDCLWHFSPWDSYLDTSDRGTLSTNILVLGAYRAGKSGSIKILVYRSLAYGAKAVVPSDSKGEWVSLAESVEGGLVIRLGGTGSARLNPLDRGPRRTGATDEQHLRMVEQRRITTLVTIVEMAMGTTSLSAAEHAVLSDALAEAIAASDDNPTLRRVREATLAMIGRLRENHAEDPMLPAAQNVELTLRRFTQGDLSGLFEDESTVQFDTDAPIVVVDTSELFQRSELVAQIAQTCTTAWTQAVISDPGSRVQRYVVREEGWRDMSSIRALQMYQQWLKLSRHYGIANIVILHKMTDVDAVGEEGSQERNLAYSVVQDIENKFIFRVNQQEQHNLQARLNLPASHVAQARMLRKGEMLAYVGRFAYVVDVFSTSTRFEYELFKTDDAMMSDRDLDTEDWVDIDLVDQLWQAPPNTSVDGWLEAGQ